MEGQQSSTQQQQPRNIFELINMNIVDMSQDIVSLAAMVQDINAKVNAIYAALYPSGQPSGPIAPGTVENV